MKLSFKQSSKKNSMSRFLCLVSIFVLVGCHKVDVSTIQNLNANRISIIGHAGLGFVTPDNYLPTNSYSSIIRTVESYNADGVEIDVQMSADGILYLYHDTRLQSKTNCDGCIQEHESDYLDQCRYQQNPFAATFSTEKVIRLDTILYHFSTYNNPPLVILDVESFAACDEEDIELFSTTIINLVKKYDAYNWIHIELSDFALLNKMKEKNDRLYFVFFGSLTDETIAQAVANGFQGMSSADDVSTKEAIQKAHDEGLTVSLFDVKIRTGAVRAVAKSPDYIQTDNIPLLQQILKE